MKLNEINFKKIIFGALLVSFITSAISDLSYGKIALAEEYMIGNFLSAIAGFGISITILFTMLWIMYELFFKWFLEEFLGNGYRYYGPCNREEEQSSVAQSSSRGDDTISQSNEVKDNRWGRGYAKKNNTKSQSKVAKEGDSA